MSETGVRNQKPLTDPVLGLGRKWPDSALYWSHINNITKLVICYYHKKRTNPNIAEI